MRILLIEDENKIANSIKKGLEQETFAVDMAFNGNDGFDLASGEEYDLIILDLMLPGMSGIDICRNLRKMGSSVPILMLTARGQIEDRVTGLDSGADDYLVKPFAFEELMARIRALIRRPRQSVGDMLRLEDLVVDTLKQEVRRGEKLINLTVKEFGLLEYLMRQKGRVVNKKQIIEHVWSYDSDILPNTVEVYIKYLRNKIDKPFSDKPELIKTIRGFGYKLGVM